MPAVKQIELFKKGTIAPIDVLEAQIAQIDKYNGPIKKRTAEISLMTTKHGTERSMPLLLNDLKMLVKWPLNQANAGKTVQHALLKA